MTKANDWWREMTPESKSFWREVIALAEDLLDGEALELRLNGQHCTPVLISTRDRATQPGRMGARARMEENVDEWWARLEEQKQNLVKGIRDMMHEVSRDNHKMIEIRSIAHSLKATLVLILKKPTGGTAEFN